MASYGDLKAVINREVFNPSENNHLLLTTKEKYVKSTMELHCNLSQTFGGIGFVKTFLRRFPFKKFYFQNEINNLNYIQYHTEPFIHKVNTIKEIMLLLINEVYVLEVAKEDCSWKKLSNKIDNQNESMRLIDSFYSTFKTFIELRNLNSHRGIFADSEKDEISIPLGFLRT